MAGRSVHRHARQVAARATMLALAVYVLACGAADTFVVLHLRQGVDARLEARLVELVRTRPIPPVLTTSPGSTPTSTQSSDDDFDDAPIFSWRVPPGAHDASALDGKAPAVPRADLGVSGATDVVLAGRSFRMAGRAGPGGWILAASSLQPLNSTLSTLLLAQGVAAPIILLTFFVVASVIGRRAAAPVERARQQQLDFTADASHELRTPLSVIEAEVGIALSEDRDAAGYRSSLERVRGESRRLRGIVNDLLWLARLDALPDAPAAEHVDLASVAAGCVRRFTPVAASRGIELRHDVVGAPTIVDAPADWLDRLVAVLLDNACRYTDSGGLIEVSVTAGDGQVRLTVDDSGPGITNDQREQIFRRFHRAIETPGGAGLGLPIANAVVTATGGRWVVDKAPIGGAHIGISWSAIKLDPNGR